MSNFPQLDTIDVFRELTESASVRRLEDVSFLGAIERLRASNHNSGSRLDHSIGVAYLAFLGTLHLDSREQETAISAALLHDIGHGPLSHSTEAFFKNRFQINHKTEGRRLLRADIDIVTSLIRHEINIERVENLAFGKKEDPLSFLFHYSINIDTIEGIQRSAEYFGISDAVPQSSELVQLLVTPDRASQQAGDRFWKLKDTIYSEHIYSIPAVTFDVICCLTLENMKAAQSDFSLSDSVFFAKFKNSVDETFKNFLELAKSHREPLKEILSSRNRNFTINENVDVLEPGHVINRYR
jgi:uncharacterized protein